MAENNPTVPKRQLGRALQQLRETADMTRDQVAALLECSVSKVGRIEQGLVSVKLHEFRALVDAFGASEDKRAELDNLARNARKRRPRNTYAKVVPDWFRRYRDLEEAATELRKYDTELVTGLLQTEDYARAITAASDIHTTEVEQHVQARITRQGRLLDRDDPVKLWAIMAEGALRTQVGGRKVLRDQLDHLLEMAGEPNITIQVTPFTAGAHAASGFGFTLLRFADTTGVDVVYQEDQTSASYLDRADDPHRAYCVGVWERVVAAALSPKASTELIHTVRQEL